jgi:hypothetical protein
VVAFLSQNAPARHATAVEWLLRVWHVCPTELESYHVIVSLETSTQSSQRHTPTRRHIDHCTICPAGVQH